MRVVVVLAGAALLGGPLLGGAAVPRALAAEDAAPAGVSLDVAEARLKALKRLLKRRRSSNAEINRAIDEVQDAYVRLAPEASTAPDGGPDPDFVKRARSFQGRAERAWLKALSLSDVPRGTKSNRRQPVQFRAIRALARARPEASEGFQRTLERKVMGQSDYHPWPSLYDAAFMALVGLGGEGSFEWLLERALNADVNENDKHRALAALEAMMAMRVTGDQRRAAVRRILAIFQSYAFHWPNKYEAVAGYRSTNRTYVKVAGTASHYWLEVRPVVLRALRRFSVDPRSTLPPFERGTTDELASIPRYLNWFATHQRAGTPPWVDADPAHPMQGRTRRDGRYAGTSLPPLLRQYGVPWEDWWLRHRRIHRRPARTGDADVEKERVAEAALRRTLREKVMPERLAEALGSAHEELRAVAAVTLGKLRGPKAAEQLAARLAEDESEMVREAATLGLMVLQDEAQKARFRALAADADENPRVRAYALLALGVLGDGATLRTVLRPAKDATVEPRARIRADLEACAAYGLALTEDKSLAGLALELLGSRTDTAAQGHAGTALARLGGAAHATEVLDHVRDPRNSDDTEVRRTAAAIALGHVMAADDRKAFRTLRTRMARTKGPFGGVRSELFVAVGRIGGERAEDLLLDAYEHCVADTRRYAERGYALIGLGLLGTPRARTQLRMALEEMDHEKDLGAGAVALALAGDRGGISVLRGHLGASRRRLAAHAMVALGMLGDTGSARAVREIVLRRRDPFVLAEAGLALGLLEGAKAADDLAALWARCPRGEQRDTLAWALHLAAGPKARDLALRILADEDRPALERAYALAALGRMADPAEDPLLGRFGRSFNPYVDAPTLDLLARHRDLAFLY